MPLSFELPAEIEAFVRAEVAEGAAMNEAEFVAKAVGLYRELKERHADLRDHLRVSLDQARNGDVSLLDMDDIIAEMREQIDENGQPL